MELSFDIGTTTIAGTSDSGKNIVIDNAQKIYGSDILSRINAVSNSGYNVVRKPLIDSINSVINSLCTDRDSVSMITVAANTAESCFLANADISPLAVHPYKSNELFGKEYKAHDLDINCKNARLYIAPCFSAFCGGDISAGMIASDMDRNSERYIYIDIGTNGEMVISTGKGVFYCSCATGPAFEGGNISCGVSGIPGAINRFNSDFSYSTIGSKPAVGICGSGLIDLVYFLKKDGRIDETGTILDGQAVRINSSIFITQKDITAIQLAKSAVCSGIECLMLAADVTADSIDRLYISGIMGAKISIESACGIGMLPAECKNKCTALGNMALAGAVSMKSTYNRTRAASLIAKSKHLPLSGNKYFEKRFAENMFI